MLLEEVQRDDLEGLLVGSREYDGASHSLVGSVFPCLGADAPPVARREAGEPVLGHRRDQIVPLGARELQEPLGDQAANGMQAPVVAVSIAAAIPVPSRQGVGRASLQLGPKNVERWQQRCQLGNLVD